MVTLLRQWASTGYGVPSVCVRHGQVAVQQRRTKFVSRPPSWAAPFVLLGGIGYVLVIAVVRKMIFVPNWPFCQQCKDMRLVRLVIGVPAVVTGLTMILVGLAVPDPLGAYVLLAGILLSFVGLFVVSRAHWAHIADTMVSDDGEMLEVRQPHPFFAGQMSAMLSQAIPLSGYGPPPAYQPPVVPMADNPL